MSERHSVFCISQEMDLVYVKRMQFPSLVENAPVLISADTSARHRTGVGRKLAAIDVEAVLVLRKRDSKLRHCPLQRLNVDALVDCRAVIDCMQLLPRGM